jgi:ABC-2 type transport system permease protein
MRRAVRAEWTKLRTSPGTAWLLAGVVVATVGLGAWAAGVAPCTTAVCPVDPARTSLTGVMFGQAVVAIVAVLVVGDEYATGMVRVTLAAVPRRWAVLTAKASVTVLAVAAVAVPAVAASLAAGRVLLPVFDGALWRAGVGSVLYLVLIALLSVGVAVVLRNSAAAIGTVLGLLYVVPVIALSVPDPDWKRHLEQVAPMSAGLAVQATRGLDDLPIGPWRGLAVLAAWATVALVAAAIFMERRDA